MVKVSRCGDLVYADDAGKHIASQSPKGLKKMMISITVRTAETFGLVVSGPRTEIVCLYHDGMEECQFTINAAGQTIWCTVCKIRSLRGKISGRTGERGHPADGECVCDRRELPIDLEARLFKAEVVDMLLHGCAVCSLSSARYVARCQFFTRCSGWRNLKRRVTRTNGTLPCPTHRLSSALAAPRPLRQLCIVGGEVRRGTSAWNQRYELGGVVRQGRRGGGVVHEEEEVCMARPNTCRPV